MAHATTTPPPAEALFDRLLAEGFISLQAAARMLGDGRGGRPLNASTLWRWIKKGLIGPTGGRIRLEAVPVGSGWRTTAAAVRRFNAARVPADVAAAAVVRTPRQRQAAAERAERELIAAGA